MKIAFSTLACPEWSIEQAAQAGKDYGYDGIELRLLDGEVIPSDLSAKQRRRVAAACREAGLAIAALDSSIRLTADDTAASIKDLKAFLELARELETPLVRVWGGNGASDQAVRVLAETAPDAERLGIGIALETHDAFSSARSVAAVLDHVPSPRVGALWDTHHPYRFGDTPQQVLDVLGPRLLHVHVKDARRQGEGWRLVLLGEGEVPVRESLEAVERSGYAGWVSVEWEKKWHPEIESPEVALPQHLKQLRQWLGVSRRSANA